MAYQRKTRDYYDVEGNYGSGHDWEAVTAEDSRREAMARLREYRENKPGVTFRLRARRERIAPAATPEP